jgi:hypothetical protein
MPQYQVIVRGTYEQPLIVTADSPSQAKLLVANGDYDEDGVIEPTSWRVAKDAAIVLDGDPT